MTTTINASTSAGLVNTADTSGILQLQTAGTAAVTIDASQNVGVGTATPQAKLHANSANNATSLLLTPNSGGTAGDYTQLGWGNSSGSATVYGGIRTAFLSPTGTSAVSMQFWTDIGSSNYAERMRIDSNGNVGIKITAPTAPLHVNAVPTGYISKFSGTGVSKFYIAAPAADGGIMDLGALNNSEGALTQIRFNGQLNIGSTGNLGLGNATPSSSGTGITFPATQSASSDANTLDDYEEGTWTPDFSSSGATFSGAAKYGTYVKVGQLVYAQFYMNQAASGTLTNDVTIIGLPFGSNPVLGSYNQSSAATWQTGGTSVGFTVDPNNATSMTLWLQNAGAVTAKAANISNIYIVGQVTYRCNS